MGADRARRIKVWTIAGVGHKQVRPRVGGSKALGPGEDTLGCVDLPLCHPAIDILQALRLLLQVYSVDDVDSDTASPRPLVFGTPPGGGFFFF